MAFVFPHNIQGLHHNRHILTLLTHPALGNLANHDDLEKLEVRAHGIAYAYVW